ncbi:MAG: adenosylcobinamide-GDP ribazoletransferase [Acidimicrobiia bacterium]|nr:adenosylcobinamide-GDP ribazoletransferase [Acidimicrobiia bacterium]
MGAAFGFLTVFGRHGRRPDPSALVWFPVVGVVVGGAVGMVWWAGQRWTNVLLAAALVVLADAVLTGGLHLDGLADSADGLLAPLETERRLAAMADPAVGAFGVMALVTVLGVRWAALASVVAQPALLAGLWCLSRTLMALVVSKVPYARPGGLAEAFAGGSPLVAGALGGALAGGLCVGAGAAAGAVAVVTAAVAGLCVVAVAARRIGGFTGDVLGAAGVVAETAGLVAYVVVAT